LNSKHKQTDNLYPFFTSVTYARTQGDIKKVTTRLSTIKYILYRDKLERYHHAMYKQIADSVG